MARLIRILILVLICIPQLFSQTKIGEFDSYNGFSKGNQATGYYSKNSSGYRVNFQMTNKIVRNKYDNDFKLKDSYEYQTQDYTLNSSFIGTPVFTIDLQLEKAVYEIYADKKKLTVVAPDFQQKKDSVIYSLDMRNQEGNEKKLAVMPYSKGLRVLTFSNKLDKLFIYNWKENGQTDTVEFSLPESSLSTDEIKKYTKDAKVKYKSAFDDLIVSRANSISAIGYAGKNYVYYTDDKIWLVLQTPLCTGFHILELDMNKQTVLSSNYMINDMRKNSEAKNETLKTPFALIWKNYLIIRNSSYYFFQYQFYDLTTKQLVKEFTASSYESLQKIIHSDFNQKGTWLSGGDEKKLDNEKAYLRKLGAGDGFIFLSKDGNDSIAITTGSLKKTEGLIGSVVGIGTMFIGTALNFTIGNFQIIPYLQLYRNKLVYSHSCFSSSTFELSTSQNIYTSLDFLLDNFEQRDLKSNSSFVFIKDGKYMVAVLNPDSKKFELYTL